MSATETRRLDLPVSLDQRQPRPSLQRTETSAEFVSQLLAERYRLAPQRMRRRSTPEGAVDAYAEGAKAADKRMPMGYRKTILA